ncbi:MAG: four helix bundle protein [Gemmatimonadota bacterium]|nr:four helix bundle protein [Gemmatimonadota bacterium]
MGSRARQLAGMDPRVEVALAGWAPGVAVEETSDPLWRLHSYRVARCLLDHLQGDAVVLAAHVDPKTVAQLSRAVASMGANIAEGYSRRSNADRSRFYGYALGSTREAMLWYRSVAWCLDHDTLELRMACLMQARCLLIGMLKAVQRSDAPPFEPRV